MRKINSAYRVIKIFQMLYKKPHSMQEICTAFNSEKVEITCETVTKYFKTLRKFGCRIEKQSGRFTLKSVPFSLDLEEKDFKSLALLENILTSFGNGEFDNEYRGILDVIFSLADYNSAQEYEKYLEKTKNFDFFDNQNIEKIVKLVKYALGKQKARVLVGGEFAVISNVSFWHYDNKIFIHCFFEDEKIYKLFCLDNVKDILPLPSLCNVTCFAQTTVFELYGRLKKAYMLREDEKIIEICEDKIVVANNFDDKNALLRRLIKYGDKCRIISPKKDVDAFLKMLDKMAINLR